MLCFWILHSVYSTAIKISYLLWYQKESFLYNMLLMLLVLNLAINFLMCDHLFWVFFIICCFLDVACISYWRLLILFWFYLHCHYFASHDCPLNFLFHPISFVTSLLFSHFWPHAFLFLYIITSLGILTSSIRSL